MPRRRFSVGRLLAYARRETMELRRDPIRLAFALLGLAAAFRLILSDPGVRVVLVNIFGGIVRCDLIAEGIVSALQQVATSLPVVVRLQGTNVERGREILDHADDFLFEFRIERRCGLVEKHDPRPHAQAAGD